jgi:lysozyme
MPIRAVPTQALNFLERVEGLSLTPYKDSADNWTNGYGHRLRADEVAEVWTRAKAYAELVADADEAANRLSDRVSEAAILKLTENQYAALISFVFNLGAGAGWRIWDYVNTGQLSLVPAEMLRFNHVTIAGKLIVNQGLTNRRLAEVALWNEVDPAVAAPLSGEPTDQLPSGFVRNAETPPAPPAPKPLALASLLSKVLTVTTAVGAAATQVQGLLVSSQAAPLLALVPQSHEVALGLTGVAVASSALSLVISRLQTIATAL